MAPTPAPFCPQCGASLQGSQRFCTNCGATIEPHASNPTLRAAQNPSAPSAGTPPTELAGTPGAMYPYQQGTPASFPPQAQPGSPGYSSQPQTQFTAPPPPPETYNPYTNSIRTNTPSYTPPPPERAVSSASQPVPFQVPDYAQKPKGRGGCAVVSVLLLLVLAIGIGGYFVFHALSSKNTSAGNTNANGTPTYNTNQGPTATATAEAHAVTTEQLNLQVTYASVSFTILSVQKAASFSDDSDATAGSAGLVRVNFRENNTTTGNPDYVEVDSLLLVLPGNTTVQASAELNGVSPDQGVNRLNWLDYPLNAQVALNQLTLRMGKQGENQMDIPLQANANVSMYQDKTANPNSAFKYGALNMTLKTATLSYSYHDQQATAGNRYVIIMLGAYNPASYSIDVYAPTYMRLQAGSNTVQPDYTYTFPYTIDASTSASGVVAFLVPQGISNFTLLILAQSSASPAISQATEHFQIQ